ncbi:MAG TPA: hypothetical protein VJX68_03165 [Candidatus Binatus sp.]|uniref:hypothetical protein n=1 Tax=Candidatus Binatus sp. TaxID=2811406 RepID=UPI002B497759|nr:hypothetical protein [Candidatus Binatus sp.]HKN12172.1 hypothetical protein [Candidatus Binatus sp.]
MSFASNWLEELVAEWLELEGYLVMMRPPVHLPGSHGGRFEPDVVGARIREGKLQIRHCESTVAFAGNPEYEEQRVNKKFQLPLKQRVYELFCVQFGIQKDPGYDYALNYETWAVYGYASRPVEARLGAIQGLILKKVDDLIADEVIESLANWGEERQTDQYATLDPTRQVAAPDARLLGSQKQLHVGTKRRKRKGLGGEKSIARSGD